MSMPGIIDADTHIIEPAGIWELMDKEMYHRRPVLVSVPGDTLYKGSNAFWLIDGNIFPKPAGRGGFALHTPAAAEREVARRDIEIGSREITDPAARLRDMDRRSVEVQVVYPTLFIIYLTDDVDLEVALCRAYNRWMSHVWDASHNRLRWPVVLPLHSIDESIKEMRKAKKHGAVGVFLRGLEGDRSVADPYFFPIYEEASSLGLPLCIHTGAGSPRITNAFDIGVSGTFSHVRLLPLMAFRDIVANKIPERFPELRFGFIEAGASWVPYLLHQLKRLFRGSVGAPGREPETEWGPELFEKYRFYVACEADENLPYLTSVIGEEHIIVGSDYGHQDPSEEREMVARMRSREDVPNRVIEKILCENPRSFYGL
jgi:predicted TIM-barrel fold metal-dependent hydrolase